MQVLEVREDCLAVPSTVVVQVGRSSSIRTISAARGGGQPAGHAARACQSWRIASRASVSRASASAAPASRAVSACRISRAVWCASHRVSVLLVRGSPSSATICSPSAMRGSACCDSSVGVDEVDAAARGPVSVDAGVGSVSSKLNLHDEDWSGVREVAQQRCARDVDAVPGRRDGWCRGRRRFRGLPTARRERARSRPGASSLSPVGSGVARRGLAEAAAGHRQCRPEPVARTGRARRACRGGRAGR